MEESGSLRTRVGENGMKREEMLKELSSDKWDVLIIGGGASGLGAAVDAASRGLRTLLLEQSDFAKGTSSRSTKLIHGGLRYLQHGHIKLVREALKERGILCKNAPRLVNHLPLLIPSYKWWEGPFYRAGLLAYDLLAGSLGIEKSFSLSREQILQKTPTIQTTGLRGGNVYYDGQFDDSRLAITLARTFAKLGGVLINYMPVISLIKTNNDVCGVKAVDLETDVIYQIKAAAVVNATGPFTDQLRKMDDPDAPPLMVPSQGIHLVVDRSFLPSDTGILIPHTEDGRVLFILPWHDRVLMGTTDTLIETPTLEPKPQADEIDFVLRHAGKYLTRKPERKDILSVFAGIRPLVRKGSAKNTGAISREHTIAVSHSGLITLAGGKWTTYRKMGEDVIDKAISVASLPNHPSLTAELPLHDSFHEFNQFLEENPGYEEPLHPKLPYCKGEVVWAARYEMARSIEDVLARRTRSLLLDAKASVEAAIETARIMAKELQKDEQWEAAEISRYQKLAAQYQI